MKIRMYNVGFGDAFCIRDRKNSLLVDFGTNNSRIEDRPRREIFDVIISDLSTINSKNLLLTNFCPDHISGFLYMSEKRNVSGGFDKIYIPDVFSKKEMSRTLALLLLGDQIKDACLPGRQVSLYAFIMALIGRNQKVELVSRGKSFEKKYQALWPDTDVIRQETDRIFDLIGKEQHEIMDILVKFAEELRRIIWSMTEQGKEESTGERILPAYVYEREFRKIKYMPEFKKLLEYLHNNKIDLKQFRSQISIVFHNERDGELNLLFTGDICPEKMRMIADNYDDKFPLHDHYWCIKVPHHGTQEYFFDFSKYEPENLLISNGIHYSNSKQQSRELRTSPLYGGLFYIEEAHMYCSNCDCCDSYENGCSCKEWDIISPSYYKDI